MNTAARVAAEFIGWLFTIMGWIAAIFFGAISVIGLYSVRAVGSPYALMIAVNAVLFCLIGAAAAILGRSLPRFFFPRSTRESSTADPSPLATNHLLASQEKQS